MGGAMHAPRCMLRASILSLADVCGARSQNPRPSRKRVWVVLSMESKRKEKSNSQFSGRAKQKDSNFLLCKRIRPNQYS